MSSASEFYPLTPKRWTHFEQLFGPHGACGGCWCMYWKLPHKEFNTLKGEGTYQAQKSSVASGAIPGILAYVNGIPAGWCAIEPREHYSTLERSRILKPVDEVSVWSVTCFFVDKNYRSRGLTVALLRAAIDYVTSQGGKVLEGYPVEPRPGKVSAPVFIYTGIASAFLKAGFKEVARRSETRPIMRYYIEDI